MNKRTTFLLAGILVLSAIATPARTARAQSRILAALDLEGFWDANTMTPLQRPPEFANRENFTPEEAADYERAFFERGRQGLARLGFDPDTQADLNDVNIIPPKLDSLRTSLIVDPADGRLPATVPAASARPRFKLSYDDPESLSLNLRCLVIVGTGNMNGNVSLASPPLVPGTPFDNIVQIVQTANTVAITSEWIHDTRIVRIGGRHLPSIVRKWLGDSIGHWEGNTLVVDTTNFRSETQNQGASANLHVIERFTRTDADTLRYRVTVEDADTWVRPWTAEWSFKSSRSPIIEVACHEGNYNTENFLRGARADERAAATKDGDR
jgi:hypothetical protein